MKRSKLSYLIIIVAALTFLIFLDNIRSIIDEKRFESQLNEALKHYAMEYTVEEAEAIYSIEYTQSILTGAFFWSADHEKYKSYTGDINDGAVTLSEDCGRCNFILNRDERRFYPVEGFDLPEGWDSYLPRAGMLKGWQNSVTLFGIGTVIFLLLIKYLMHLKRIK